MSRTRAVFAAVGLVGSLALGYTLSQAVHEARNAVRRAQVT